MPLSLDHLVISVDDLNAAVTNYQVLGFTVSPGGVHAGGATHNALVIFSDGKYLELLAATGQAPTGSGTDFSPLLRHGEGTVAHALLSTDLEADTLELQQQGYTLGDIREGRRTRPDGVELRWRTALLNGGMTPFVLQDITPRALRVPTDAASTTHANGVTGINRFYLLERTQPDEKPAYNIVLNVADPTQDYPLLSDHTRTHSVKFTVFKGLLDESLNLNR